MLRAFQRRAPLAVALLVTCLCFTISLQGLPIIKEIKKVPVQRLAENIERQLAQKPDDVQLRLNLARLYAMAYALKVAEFDATGDLQPDFGHDPPAIPRPVREATSPESEARAKADLTKAIETYQDVVKRDPANAIGHLGLAWSLEQSGDRVRAIESYRKAFATAWEKERHEKFFWRDPVAVEAAGRLRALLDPVRDATELAGMQSKISELSTGRAVTPIALSLNREVTGPPIDTAARVSFDADGSGFQREWTWIRRDAGWLVYDDDGTGRITSALQWFGSVTFWLFWENGYRALAALDDNDDGELRGPELSKLAIWQDANQNGVSEQGEVEPLAHHGIVALSTRYLDCEDEWTIARSDRGVTFTDGTTRATYDVVLRRAASLTLTEDEQK